MAKLASSAVTWLRKFRPVARGDQPSVMEGVAEVVLASQGSASNPIVAGAFGLKEIYSLQGHIPAVAVAGTFGALDGSITTYDFAIPASLGSATINSANYLSDAATGTNQPGQGSVTTGVDVSGTFVMHVVGRPK